MSAALDHALDCAGPDVETYRASRGPTMTSSDRLDPGGRAVVERCVSCGAHRVVRWEEGGPLPSPARGAWEAEMRKTRARTRSF